MSEHGIMYSFEMVDVSNGYLKMVGAMEGHLKMCYWNLKNGYKIISVYQEGCDHECEVAGFNFYIFDGDIYKNVPYEEIIPDIYNDFFLTDTNSSRTVQVIKAEMGKRIFPLHFFLIYLKREKILLQNGEILKTIRFIKSLL